MTFLSVGRHKRKRGKSQMTLPDTYELVAKRCLINFHFYFRHHSAVMKFDANFRVGYG